MKPRIIRKDPADEFPTSENCHILEISNSPEDPQVSIARARVEPGVSTRWHRLKGITERYYILSGRGLVEIGELPPREVAPGDIVIIPPLCRQRISNTGTGELVFLCICTPRFTSTAYEELRSD
ncbi:MAG: cupin domain-containing protein [Deltaproteobacteria bacterium]|nr:cupin domain-containing protein [Deltaproteobacteria bacterium]